MIDHPSCNVVAIPAPGFEHVEFHDERLVDATARGGLADLNRGRLEQAAIRDERARLARELHDGVLQSLTSATLHLELIARLVETDPSAAQVRLRNMAQMLSEQQRELRKWIGEPRTEAERPGAPTAELAAALEKLRRRAEWQHGIRVKIRLSGDETMPHVLSEHLYRIVQEGLTNIGRHAHARVGRVDLQITSTGARVVISDDGVGFPFHGTLDLEGLHRRGIGPRSLKERIDSLRGDMILTSTLSGSRLEISLPIDHT